MKDEFRRFDVKRTRTLKLLAPPLLLAVAALLIGWAALDFGPRNVAGQEVTPTDAVEIRDFRFDPAIIRVAAGTTVTWTNRDAAPHGVVALDGTWETAILKNGEKAQHTFDKEGVYEYRCSTHPGMRGVVLVGDTAEPPALNGPRGDGQDWQQHMAQMGEMMRQHQDWMPEDMDPSQCLDAMRNNGMMGPGGMMDGGGNGMMGPGGMMDGAGNGMMGDWQ